MSAIPARIEAVTLETWRLSRAGAFDSTNRTIGWFEPFRPGETLASGEGAGAGPASDESETSVRRSVDQGSSRATGDVKGLAPAATCCPTG